MINSQDPRQKRLFDPFHEVLTRKCREDLEQGWQGVFRDSILELMPVEEMASEYDPEIGAPTKELYSMAGLIVIKEFMNWTEEEAVNAYRYRMDIHFALNRDPVAQDLSVRTFQRKEKIFVDKELAAEVMSRVTTTVVRKLGIRISKQRLDSTHFLSNMALFGRTRLMVVAIKKFLTQVKRHDPKGYEELDEELRKRYEASFNRVFGGKNQKREARARLRQQVAEDLYLLVKRFAENQSHCTRSTYRTMERVLHEQCEIVEDKVELRKRMGGDILQNPSDPDATYDGKKGKGYQVQLAETCDPENNVQVLTSCIPQTAVESDAGSVPKVLDDLESKDLKPDELVADSAYGSDENVRTCEERGVELISPTQEGARALMDMEDGVGGDSKEKAFSLNIDDFVVDPSEERVLRCPRGHEPESSVLNPENGKVKTVMPASACSQCPFFEECPVYLAKGEYRLVHKAKVRRLAGRRREELTDVFRERYRIRAGIESTNSGLKRRMGMGRLRVRGRPRVFHAIFLKVAGWNILRAAVSLRRKELAVNRA